MIIGSTNVSQKVNLYRRKDQELHPAAERALKICTQHLLQPDGILDTQHCLVPTHAKYGKVLDLLPTEAAKAVSPLDQYLKDFQKWIDRQHESVARSRKEDS